MGENTSIYWRISSSPYRTDGTHVLCVFTLASRYAAKLCSYVIIVQRLWLNIAAHKESHYGSPAGRIVLVVGVSLQAAVDNVTALISDKPVYQFTERKSHAN